MAARGAKPFFSFLTFAFLLSALVAGAQAAVQWQHPGEAGWPELYAYAREGSWSPWIVMGLAAVSGLICTVLSVYSFLQRRFAIAVPSFLFAFGIGSIGMFGNPVALFIAGGSLLMFILCLKITDVLDKRASAPKTAAPSKKAG